CGRWIPTRSATRFRNRCAAPPPTPTAGWAGATPTCTRTSRLRPAGPPAGVPTRQRAPARSPRPRTAAPSPARSTPPRGAATASRDGTVSLWEFTPSGPVRRRLVGHGAPVTAVIRLPGATYVTRRGPGQLGTEPLGPDRATVTASEDGTVRLWRPGGSPVP